MNRSKQSRNPYPNLPLNDPRAVEFVRRLLAAAMGEGEQVARDKRNGVRHYYDLQDASSATISRCRTFLALAQSAGKAVA